MGALDALNPQAGEDASSTASRMTADLPLPKGGMDSLQGLIKGMQDYTPDPSAKWLSFASNIAKPTKYGTLGEVVSNVASGLEPIVNEEQKLKQQYAMMAKQMMYNATMKDIPAAQGAELGLSEAQIKLNQAQQNADIQTKFMPLINRMAAGMNGKAPPSAAPQADYGTAFGLGASSGQPAPVARPMAGPSAVASGMDEVSKMPLNDQVLFWGVAKNVPALAGAAETQLKMLSTPRFEATRQGPIINKFTGATRIDPNMAEGIAAAEAAKQGEEWINVPNGPGGVPGYIQKKNIPGTALAVPSAPPQPTPTPTQAAPVSLTDAPTPAARPQGPTPQQQQVVASANPMKIAPAVQGARDAGRQGILQNEVAANKADLVNAPDAATAGVAQRNLTELDKELGSNSTAAVANAATLKQLNDAQAYLKVQKKAFEDSGQFERARIADASLAAIDAKRKELTASQAAPKGSEIFTGKTKADIITMSDTPEGRIATAQRLADRIPQDYVSTSVWDTIPKIKPITTPLTKEQEKASELRAITADGMAKDYSNQTMGSQQRLYQLQEASTALERGAVTGPFSQVVAKYAPLIAPFVPGIDKQDFANTQILSKFLIDSAVSKARETFMGNGNRMTENEVKLMLERASPSGEMAEGALKYLIKSGMAESRYKIQMASDFQKYTDAGGNPYAFSPWYASKFPMAGIQHAEAPQAAQAASGTPLKAASEATGIHTVTSDADYNALPPNARFRAPDGSIRRKP